MSIIVKIIQDQDAERVANGASMLRIIACRMGQAPTVEEMAPGLKPMQDFVGGYIEAVRLSGEYGGGGVDLYCDEEFLLKGYAPNRLIRSDLAIHGDFFISAHDDEGETVGLTVAECEKWLAVARSWPVPIISELRPILNGHPQRPVKR